MSSINFSVNSDIIQKLEPALHALGPHQFSRAVKAASKRAATSASKVAKKEITSKWTVQKSIVGKDALKVKETNGSWSIYSRGRRPSSLAFKTIPKRGTDTTGNRRQAIFLQVYAAKQPGYIHRSWLWSAHGGLHLARRDKGKFGPKGGKYFDIKGPAVPQMLSNETVREPVVDMMIETFEKRLRHEYEYRLSKHMEGKKI